jgi:hypothetical protein
MEAELRALSSATKEAIWCRKLLHDFQMPNATEPMTIYEDDQSTIAAATNQINSDRSTRIDTKYFFFFFSREDCQWNYQSRIFTNLRV